MKKLFACLAAVAALAGCGGGGSDSPEPNSLSWDKTIYTVATSPSSTGSLIVNATLTPHGGTIPPILTVDVSPYGVGINPTPGNGPFVMNSVGQIPVQFSVGLTPTGGAGNYPKGSYPFTASMHIGGQTYTANMQIVVQ